MSDQGFSFLGNRSSNPMPLVSALGNQSSLGQGAEEVDVGTPYRYDPSGLVNVLLGNRGAPGKTDGQRALGSASGALGGAGAGAAAGAMFGSAGGPIGAIIGALVGAVGGALS